VVVTGFRASLASALNIKRQRTASSTSIKAEDIAKFPDANLAESLQRVPGVALARGDGGEGKQITVRGLNAGFTRVRINGIEGVTATGSSDINGSTNRGRGFDFSVFASELFNSLEVRKTSSAAIEEGSLGATVDLRTARPFDYKGRPPPASAPRPSTTACRAKTQPRFTGLYLQPLGYDFGKVRWSRCLFQAHAPPRKATRRSRCCRASADGGFCSPLGYHAAEPGQHARQGHRRRQLRLRRAAHLGAAGLQQRLLAAPTITAAPSPRRPPARAPSPRASRAIAARRPNTSAPASPAPCSGVRPAPPSSTSTCCTASSRTPLDNYIEAISFGRSIAQANGKPHTSILDAHFAPTAVGLRPFNGVDVRTEGLRDVYTTYFGEHVLSGRHDFNDRSASTA
jgi:iron complex outermembrane receptor protein